jgi:CubicO group peptidase (beta-lactamase class C family)
VGNYWPEFSAKGKKNVLVRHLMSRSSGVAGWDPPFTITDMCDWETSTERLAGQVPWWEPGYHANSQGHLVGEVIRQITNKTFKKFVADEIAGPLGGGLPDRGRREGLGPDPPVVPPPPMDIDFAALGPQSPLYRCFTRPVAAAGAAKFPGVAARGHGGAQRAYQRAWVADSDADANAGRFRAAEAVALNRGPGLPGAGERRGPGADDLR